MDNVKPKLCTVIKEQYQKVCGGHTATNDTIYFATMLEEGDLKKHLASTAGVKFTSLYFMPSLYSIVSVSTSTKTVYKLLSWPMFLMILSIKERLTKRR